MPPGNKRWERGQKAPRHRTLRRLLILCEDTKSAVFYLRKFPFDHDQVQIECVGTGMNTDSLMEEAINRMQAAEKGKNPYEAVWVVFDRDSFPARNFNRAFELARDHATIKACWSNECFELWYLLHFALRTTGIDRADIWTDLSRRLGQKYDKANDELFEELKPRLETAVRNAGRLAFENAQLREPRHNPSTCVHELIKVLLRFDPEKQ
jgi:RloB-like protein